MKNIIVSLFGLYFTLTQLNFSFAETQPFAVVELYTSEGCSSCPPADKVFRKLTQKARENNLKIFTLGFHVDYWDYLGWPDRMSDSSYSQRQRQYARALNSDTVYTPQMIVNGQKEFGGYRKERLDQALDWALNQKPIASIGFDRVQFTEDQVEFQIQTERAPNESLMSIALVEGRIATNVHEGENRGRYLEHENAVRYFTQISLNSLEKGEPIHLSLDKKWKSKNLSVIAFLQDQTSMHIYAAEHFNLDDFLPKVD